MPGRTSSLPRTTQVHWSRGSRKQEGAIKNEGAFAFKTWERYFRMNFDPVAERLPWSRENDGKWCTQQDPIASYVTKIWKQDHELIV